jgi:CPA2 family monovalent cation:H+ antiporter-2
VQDIFAVLVLVLLPTLFGGATSRSAIVTAVVTTALKVAGLAAFTMFVGNRLIPWLLDHVAATRSRELFTLTVLVVALGIAVGSALVFGVSMALGAFLAGLVVGRSDYSLRAASEALPMRDAFAVLFFVSIGMLLDPRALVDAPAFIIATLLVVTVGNPVAAIAAVLLLRYPLNVGLGVAAALAQIGEFSFILGGLGRDLGLLPDEAMHTIVAVAMISIVINPVLCRLATRVQYSISRRTRLVPRVSPESEVLAGRDVSPDPAHRAIVVGYGPTGRTVTRLLRDNGIEPTVIELNVDTTRRLREEGIGAVYGDATRAETLQAAGVATAGSLILTSAGMVQSEEVIRLAREMNPKIYILARASYLRDLDSLRRAGADAVFSGEGEVALAFNEAILNRLGATPEQMDRERERAHDELFKTA